MKNFCGNYMSLLYIYSYIEKSESEGINYLPEAILDFGTSKNIIDQLPKIMKENIMLKLLTGNKQNICIIYNCRICLLLAENTSNNNRTPLEGSSLYDKDLSSSSEYYNQLLLNSFKFYIEYTNFYDSLKSSLKQNVEEKIYLINKKYIDEIKSITQFIEFEEFEKKNNQLKSYSNIRKTLLLKKIEELLPKDVLDKFKISHKNKIEQRLEDKDLYNKFPKHLPNNQNTNLFYYEKFQLINLPLFDVVSKIDTNFKEKCIEVKSIFSGDKIILLLLENLKYILNVGNINNDHELIVDYLILSDYSQNNEFYLNKIMNFIKKYGYDSFKKYITNDIINLPIENMSNVKARIYRISSDKVVIDNYNESNSCITEKLKALLLLSITQIDFDKYKEYSQ